MASKQSVGPLAERRRGEHAGDVLRDARVGFDPKDLVDQFVLAQVDVHDSNRRQERLEDASGAGMVAGEERLAAQT